MTVQQEQAKALKKIAKELEQQNRLLVSLIKAISNNPDWTEQIIKEAYINS